MKAIYGTTIVGTEQILDLWFKDKEKACKELVLHISVNKPDTKYNSINNAKDTIEKWIEDNF